MTAYAPPLATQADSFLVTVPAGVGADLWPTLALKTCGDRPYCKVMAWTDPKLAPSGLPLTSAQIASLSFSYLRDRADGYEKSLWNCRRVKRPDPAQCMKQQVYFAAPSPRGAPALGSAVRRGGAEPEGVRRLGGEAPAPLPVDPPHAAGTGTTPLPAPRDAADSTR